MKTTLFYGPWQCRQQFITGCQQECALQGHRFMGCMWLADIKLEWRGSLVALPITVDAGSRYGVYHCCCDYKTLPSAETSTQREKWKRVMESFRSEWSTKFGDWPLENGKAWPCHHIRDLWHGGDPIDPNNLLPADPRAHVVFGQQYPACYAGLPPWNTAGPDLPYQDPR